MTLSLNGLTLVIASLHRDQTSSTLVCPRWPSHADLWHAVVSCHGSTSGTDRAVVECIEPSRAKVGMQHTARCVDAPISGLFDDDER